MELKVKLLHPQARLPEYATAGAACFDVEAVSSPECPAEGCQVLSGGAVSFDTGLAFEVPQGFVLLVYSRSGHGFRNNVRLANCVGVIDSDYRGELKVKLSRDIDCMEHADFRVKPGDRIAQAMLVPIPQVTLIAADQLSDTARGTGGFGHTGA